jgi:hypothetical protein
LESIGAVISNRTAGPGRNVWIPPRWRGALLWVNKESDVLRTANVSIIISPVVEWARSKQSLTTIAEQCSVEHYRF